MLLAVVNAEGEADELRQDGLTTRPVLVDFVATGFSDGFGFLQQISVV